MAKLSNYNGSIDVISGLRAKNNGDFPLAQAHDILVSEDGKRLDTMLEELAQSGGGGNGEPIEVTELPTENINPNAVYKLTLGFNDIVVSDGSNFEFMRESMEAEGVPCNCYTVPTKPTENIIESNETYGYNIYYIEDENDLFMYNETEFGGWISLSFIFNMPFGGIINDTSEITTAGYYALRGGESKYYLYDGKSFDDLIIFADNTAISYVEVATAEGVILELYKIPTQTTENIQVTNPNGGPFYLYYIDDENDIFVYLGATDGWLSLSNLMGLTNNGVIHDTSEATTEGYYALITIDWTELGGGGARIIAVDELPTENIDTNAIYKVSGICTDIITKIANNPPISYIDFISALGGEVLIYNVKDLPTENIKVSTNILTYCYYVKSLDGIYLCRDASVGFVSFSSYAGAPYGGKIHDTAEATTDGTYYALMGADQYYKYVDGTWKEFLAPEGTLTITENGTHDVTEYASVEVYVVDGAENKLPQLVDRTITEITAVDLAGVTRIGAYAFDYCTSLVSVTIPNSVTSILQSAFANCTSLTSITIPSSVTSLGINLFSSCTSLANITFESEYPPNIGADFGSLNNSTTITVPAGCGEAYRTANGWSAYADKIVEATA